MQQGNLNSHFKVKKRSEDFSQGGKLSGVKMTNEKSSDDKIAVSVTGEKGKRFKRIPRGEEDSFEREEVKKIGKRTKLSEKKKTSKKDKAKKDKILKEKLFQTEIKNPCQKSPLRDDSDISKTNSKSTQISEDLQLVNMQPITDNREESPKTTVCIKKEKTPIISEYTKKCIESALKQKEGSKNISNLDNRKSLNFIEFQQNKLIQTPNKFNNNFSVNNSLTNLTSEKKVQDIVPLKEPKEMVLSSKTLEAMNQLKSERKNRFLREEKKERVRSESSFSLRFKYEELLKSERELILPPHYKSLYNAFVHLDSTLSFFKTNARSKASFLEEVKQAIESTYKQ
jgi:hypothetical protein